MWQAMEMSVERLMAIEFNDLITGLRADSQTLADFIDGTTTLLKIVIVRALRIAYLSA